MVSNAFAKALARRHDSLGRWNLLSEGTKLDFLHFEKDTHHLSGPKVYAQEGLFNRTVKTFLVTTGARIDQNELFAVALKNCDQTTKIRLSAVIEPRYSSFWYYEPRLTIGDEKYCGMSNEAYEGVVGAIDYAAEIIRAIKKGIGTEEEQREAAKLLLDCKFRTVPPKISVFYTPTNLEIIAGIIDVNARDVNQDPPKIAQG